MADTPSSTQVTMLDEIMEPNNPEDEVLEGKMGEVTDGPAHKMDEVMNDILTVAAGKVGVLYSSIYHRNYS